MEDQVSKNDLFDWPEVGCKTSFLWHPGAVKKWQNGMAL